VGNYGVPSREETDSLLNDLPAYFEAKQIHIAGLVVAAYAGDAFSHHLATSSLATWLKEQGVPAITGVDTRALTKRIRTEGSMLGRLLRRTAPSPISKQITAGAVNTQALADPPVESDWRPDFEQLEWVDPNKKNLVAEGDVLCASSHPGRLTLAQCRSRSPSSTLPTLPRPSNTPQAALFV
jgi:carbamoyl-phosphate synthase / aspartate carbamoyltransferase